MYVGNFENVKKLTIWEKNYFRLPNEVYQTEVLAKFLSTSQSEPVNLNAELTTSDEEDVDNVDKIENTEQGESSNQNGITTEQSDKTENDGTIQESVEVEPTENQSKVRKSIKKVDNVL